MKHLTSKIWWGCAGRRAVRTFAQAALAAIGTACAMHEVDWRMVASVAGLAALFSLLTSLKGLPEVQNHLAADE